MCKEARQENGGLGGALSAREAKIQTILHWEESKFGLLGGVETRGERNERRETQRIGPGCADALGYHRILFDSASLRKELGTPGKGYAWQSRSHKRRWNQKG